LFAQDDPNLYRMDNLQQILEMAKQQHTVVIGYMPPYHPVLRDMLRQRTQFTPIVQYVTKQLDDLEKSYPFYYMNFIDSDSFSDGNTGLFHDRNHPNEKGSALMMQQLYDQFHSDVKPS